MSDPQQGGALEGIAECYTCGHRWLAVLGPGDSVDWIDCPECGEQGRLVRYPIEREAHTSSEPPDPYWDERGKQHQTPG